MSTYISKPRIELQLDIIILLSQGFPDRSIGAGLPTIKTINLHTVIRNKQVNGRTVKKPKVKGTKIQRIVPCSKQR